MIYGFDDDRERFLLCDNGIDGRYRTDIVCSYAEIREGYEKYVVDNVKLDLHDSILMIKPTEDRYGYEFPVRVFVAQIREYMNLDPAFGGREREEAWVYGFDNYRYLVEYVEGIIKGRGEDFRKDIRCFCALHDHKKSLLYTFGYFGKQGLVDRRFAERYSYVEKTALLIRNLMMKLYVKYTNETASSILEHLKGMMENEREILCEFLEDYICKILKN